MTHKNSSVAILCLLFAAICVMAAAKPLGSWDCVSTAPGGGEMKWTLTLSEEKGNLVGTASSDEGSIPIDDPKYENDTLAFKVTLDSGTYEITMKFDGDKVDGSWKGGGETGSIKGSKKAA